MCMVFNAVALAGFASFPILTNCLALKPPDVSKGAQVDSALPDAVAWFHPPKLGTSFGNVLAHAANASLPDCARISECSHDPSAPHHESFSIHNPFKPHRCIQATDGFMVRYPPETWFRSTNWWSGGGGDNGLSSTNLWKWGEHLQVTDASSFATYSFYGLFRPPHRQLSSNYFRMLDGGGVGEECQKFLGINKEDVPALRNFSDSSAGLNAFLTYAQSRQGYVTKMLAGVGEPDISMSGCPGPDPAQSQPGNSDVAVALKRLHDFRFVGLTDDWERSVCLFHRMHGDRPCKPAEFANNRKTSTDDETQFDRLFREHGFTDKADQTLFEAARKRFKQDLKLWDVHDAACKRLKCTIQAHQNSKCSS